MNKENTKCGFVALFGETNAGKSTLLNQILGTKISIISHKVQTTRTRIVGVKTIDNTQLVFADIPGIFNVKKRLDKSMVSLAYSETSGADEILFLLDSVKGLTEITKKMIEYLKKIEKQAVLVLNKVDKIKKEKLLPLTKELNDTGVFKETFMISALKGSGVVELVRYLSDIAPMSPWHYPKDQVTDINDKLYYAEITREKIYQFLHKELPYSITVETESVEINEEKNSITINQIVYVLKDSHRKIFLGKGGSSIKTIGERSRKDLENLLGKKVNLFLFVKVKENWMNDIERYQNMGLEF